MAYGASPPQRPSGSVRGRTPSLRQQAPVPLERKWTDDHYVSEAMGGISIMQVSTEKDQSDVERVVRVRRRLLAEKRLDALVRQAQLLHRARVLHE